MDETKISMLSEAHQYCDEIDASSEYMIQYMQDYANATHDEVIEYLQTKSII